LPEMVTCWSRKYVPCSEWCPNAHAAVKITVAPGHLIARLR
jgi:hypothetical protein